MVVIVRLLVLTVLSGCEEMTVGYLIGDVVVGKELVDVEAVFVSVNDWEDIVGVHAIVGSLVEI